MRLKAFSPLFGCCVLLGCAARTPVPKAPQELFGGPSRVLVDTTGKRWTLDDRSHKVVLIEFWATTCGPCIESMPALHAMYRELRPQGLVMLSVNADGKRERAARFLERRPFPNPVILDDGSAWRSWGVTKLPTMILLREGKLLRKWEGQTSVSDVSAAIRALFQANTGSGVGAARRP